MARKGDSNKSVSVFAETGFQNTVNAAINEVVDLYKADQNPLGDWL